MTSWSSRVSAFVCLNLMVGAAWSQETTNYTYDALGRLRVSATVGGPANGVQTTTSLDAAGNRTAQVVAGAPSTDPTFSVMDATVTEGAVAVVTVIRTGLLTAAQSISYATADSTATQPADYAATTGTLNFAAGESSKTFSVATAVDSVFEGNETFAVNLSSPTNGAVIGDGAGVVTLNESITTPVVSIDATASTIEGSNAVVTVTRAGPTTGAVSVNYATANGTAAAPGDFTAIPSGVLNFASGETTKTITVVTTNDTVYEPTEEFTINLSGASGGGIGNGLSTVTINDNDPPPVFSIANVTVSESASSVTFTVTKTGSTGQVSSVNYATSNGTATAGADYTLTPGTLSFAAGDTTKTITVPLLGDTIYEGNETFSVNLSTPINATISGTNGSATATITDNDPAPTFSIAGATVTEGALATITVTKSGSTSIASSVNYATSNGTATAPDFYVAKSGSLSFGATETSKTFTVSTAQNQYYDGSKAFSVGLSTPVGATLATASATVNLNDDEAVPIIQIMHVSPSNGQVEEGNAQSYSIFTVGSPIRSTIGITYATATDTANASDFTAVSGSGAISGSTAKQFSVQTIEDSVIESNETFKVTVTRPASGLGSNFSYSPTNGTLTTTIVNDDYTVQSPVANPDNAGSVPFCGVVTINPITNDTDPGGRYPLTLISANTPGFTQVKNGNSLELTKTAGGTAGTKTLSYVVRNTGGAEATGTITVNVTGPSCIN